MSGSRGVRAVRSSEFEIRTNWEDPVMACDGHTYERAAIEAWLSASPTSPKTGEVLIKFAP